MTDRKVPGWVGKLSDLIKSWLSSNPERTMAELHRRANKHVAEDSEISYGTIKHAAKGDHEVNFTAALALINVVIPDKDGRKDFIREHFSQYFEFAREILDDDIEKGRGPELSDLEIKLLLRLAKRCEMDIDKAKFFLGEKLYANFLAWLRFHKLGKEDGHRLVTSTWFDIPGFSTVTRMISSTLDTMDAKTLKGDLAETAFGMTTRDAATQCWYILHDANEKCDTIIRNNPGEHEILIATIQKYD